MKNIEFNFIPLKKKKYKIHVPIIMKSVSNKTVVGYHLPGSANLE